MKKKSTGAEGAVRPLVPAMLLLFAVGESLLSIYQWLELLAVRGGAQAACAIGETVNCETVWNSPFASTLHGLTGLPVAALGLVWGLTATVLSGLYFYNLKGGRSLTGVVLALRLVAGVGALACIVFILGSFSARALCLTCLATYALVFGFALTAFVYLPGDVRAPKGELPGAILWAAGLTLLFWGLLLPMGLRTPRASVDSGSLAALPNANGKPASADAPDAGPAAPLSEREEIVAEFLRRLAPAEQQQIANNLAMYRNSEPKAVNYPTRRRLGPDDAPVKIVDFTDMKCGHCKVFEESMSQLKRVLPSELMSIEARQFPLAGECLPRMPRPDPTGVRCLAAKSLICLEESPQFWELRSKMFEAQNELTPALVRKIATSGTFSAQQLDACVSNRATQEKLEQDMAYAEAYGIEGTPLVLVNGRVAPPFPPSFLYALVMVGGNGQSAAFNVLPPPSISGRDPHEGHGH